MDGNPPKNVIKNKLINALLFSYRVNTIVKYYLFAKRVRTNNKQYNKLLFIFNYFVIRAAIIMIMVKLIQEKYARKWYFNGIK